MELVQDKASELVVWAGPTDHTQTARRRAYAAEPALSSPGWPTSTGAHGPGASSGSGGAAPVSTTPSELPLGGGASRRHLEDCGSSPAK